jgi:hypothetical protein
MKSGGGGCRSVHHSKGAKQNAFLAKVKNKKISPPLCASVLKPGFNLGVCHFEQFGKSGTFSRRQVFLLVESLL